MKSAVIWACQTVVETRLLQEAVVQIEFILEALEESAAPRDPLWERDLKRLKAELEAAASETEA